MHKTLFKVLNTSKPRFQALPTKKLWQPGTDTMFPAMTFTPMPGMLGKHWQEAGTILLSLADKSLVTTAVSIVLSYEALKSKPQMQHLHTFH